MFRGFSPINLDDKGRLAVPTRYRGVLRDCCAQQLILTASLDECLYLYPLPEWEIVEAKIRNLPSMDDEAKWLKRMLMGYAAECELDNQGRVLIPEHLRQLVGIGKRVVLVGQGNKFEIWDEDIWNRTRDGWVQNRKQDAGAKLSPGLESLSF